MKPWNCEGSFVFPLVRYYSEMREIRREDDSELHDFIITKWGGWRRSVQN